MELVDELELDDGQVFRRGWFSKAPENFRSRIKNAGWNALVARSRTSRNVIRAAELGEPVVSLVSHNFGLGHYS
jgi:hypothetical protein